MTSADSCKMGGIEDVRMVRLGNLYGSGMGYHGNILLKTNAGAREAEIEGLIYWEGGQSHRQNT